MTISMPPTRFDFMFIGNDRRSATVHNSSLSYQANMTKIRSRLVEQVFNNRKYYYRNRVEINRCSSALISIKEKHRRERLKQIAEKQKVIEELQKIPIVQYPSASKAKLVKSRDSFRFGVRAVPVGSQNSGERVKSAKSPTPNRPQTVPLLKSTANKIESKDNERKLSVTSSDLKREMTVHDENSNSTKTRLLVRMKTFSLENEAEFNEKYANWMAEKKKNAMKISSKSNNDRYNDDIQQRNMEKTHETTSNLPKDLIEEHMKTDQIFAEHYRQFLISKRLGHVPNFDLEHRQALPISYILKQRAMIIEKPIEKRPQTVNPFVSLNDPRRFSKRIEQVLDSLKPYRQI